MNDRQLELAGAKVGEKLGAAEVDVSNAFFLGFLAGFTASTRRENGESIFISTANNGEVEALLKHKFDVWYKAYKARKL
jgi:hypothetical protein